MFGFMPGKHSSFFNQTIQIYRSIFDYLNKLLKCDIASQKQIANDWEIPFERLQILEFLQSGFEGSVFYGAYRTIPVAIKKLRSADAVDISHLKHLNHPNILKFFGESCTSSIRYIIMEYCQYGTLYDHLHSGRQLRPTKLADFTIQIANGMRYLHSKNIIHGDLKTRNILLSQNDILKISDFGTQLVTNNNQTIESNNYIGTPSYMAPEIIRNEPYSFQVDVWSYGVIIWEILLSEEPYKNMPSAAIIWGVAMKSMSLPIPETLPEGYKMILSDCWRTEPKMRLTFNQVCIILRGAVQEITRIKNQNFSLMQAEWKRDVRKLLYNQEPNEKNENLCEKAKALEDEWERIEKLREKTRLSFLQVCNCIFMVKQREDDVEKKEELLKKRELELQEREKNILIREQKFKNNTVSNRIIELQSTRADSSKDFDISTSQELSSLNKNNFNQSEGDKSMNVDQAMDK